MIKNLSLKWTLVLAMVLAGVLPMGVSSLTNNFKARAELEAISADRLAADVNTRSAHLESYLSIIELQAKTFGKQPVVISALEDLTLAFDTAINGTTDETTVTNSLRDFYSNVFLPELNKHSDLSPSVESLLPQGSHAQALQFMFLSNNEYPLGEKDGLVDSGSNTLYDFYHVDYHPVFREFLKRFEYHDIFLVEASKGQMVYSVYKETDFATNLFEGPHKNSGLAKAAREAMALERGNTVMVDFDRYLPSYNAPAAFIGTPVYSGDRLLGSLVFQFPREKINAIVNTHDGLGETGEAILVGSDGLRRSQSRFTDDDLFLKREISVDALHSLNASEVGAIGKSHGGVEYLSSQVPIEIGDLGWTLITRIETSEALAAIRELTLIAVIVAGIAVLVVAAGAYWLARRLNAVLGGDPVEIHALAESIGKGHLMPDEQDNYATGARGAMVQMRSRLREVLSDSRRITEAVSAEATTMATGSEGLSERTEQQAGNLEETASSTQELSITVRRNADNAVAANELAVGTRKLAVDNGKLAKTAISAMQDINHSSGRIADIISVIDEIAFQTNLLALNAAVEAARAGEQGRGFAVVATEVRQLAGRSASAAKEIKELIDDSVKQVQDGTGIVERSGTALEEILTSITSLTDIVGQISVASEEQATGIDQINKALADMDGMTQQNMGMAESADQTSCKLDALAKELTDQMDYFTVEHRH